MIEGEDAEQLLDRFRKWLEQTHKEAALLDAAEPLGPPPASGVGIDRLVEEFTALRHEIKLQTRSARALEERLESSLAQLGDAASALRAAQAREDSNASTADKPMANALAELDEALERGREQWQKSAERLIGTKPFASVIRLKELEESQSWWQRRRTRAYREQVRQLVEQVEEQFQTERRAVFEALLSGYGLIQQRLAKSMASAGVIRIRTVGQTVDPEQMIVIEVVDGAGVPGQVVEEIRRGYTWHGQLLRPAEVRAIRPRFESVTNQESS